MLRRIYHKMGLGHPETRLVYVLGALQVLALIIHDWRF